MDHCSEGGFAHVLVLGMPGQTGEVLRRQHWVCGKMHPADISSQKSPISLEGVWESRPVWRRTKSASCVFRYTEGRMWSWRILPQTGPLSPPTLERTVKSAKRPPAECPNTTILEPSTRTPESVCRRRGNSSWAQLYASKASVTGPPKTEIVGQSR